MKSKLTKLKQILVISSLIGVTFIIYGTWAMQTHGFDIQKYNKIEIGMSVDQVTELMGEPYSVQTLDDGTTAYDYGHGLKWCFAYIRFDQYQKVETKWHDH